jgi:phosphohistidine swiveling domain-containing protein
MSYLEQLNKNIRWRKTVSRKSPFLWRYLEVIGYTSRNLKDSFDLEGIDVKLVEDALYTNDTFNSFVNAINLRVKEDINYFYQVAEKCYEYAQEFLETCRRIKREKLEQKSNKELKELFEEYVERNLRIIASRPVVFVLDKILDTMLSNEIGKLEREGIKVKLYLDMILPLKDLPFVKERKELLKLGKEIEEDPAIRKIFESDDLDKIYDSLPEEYKERISKHAEEFGWITTARYFGEPYTVKDVIRNIKEVLGRCGESLRKLEEEKKQKLLELEEIKRKSDFLRKLIEIAQEYAYLRTYRIDAVLEGDYLVRQLFQEIGRRSGLQYEDIIYLTVPEIIGLLDKQEMDEKVLRDKIRERKEAFVIFLINDQIFIVEGKEAKKFKEEIKEEAEITEILKGMVAQRGKVIGRVVKVLRKDDIWKVREGDVIVSPMTTPDMIIGLVKASAIVTDEGGVACHAAIISREFDIPCIIGTKVATKILKDGDLVEVNALDVEGEVKKLMEVT